HCKHPRYEYPISLYYRGLIINGRIDIFCKNIILEFKTGKEKEEDMNQIKLYLYMVNKILNYEDLEGFLIYINDKKIKRVEFDKNIENEIENLMENNNKKR
ncbi:MAG: CRISPR-associated protein Cas4, partial [Thermoplasmata archaeon]